MPPTLRHAVLACALLVACSGDGSTPGLREPCAEAGGPLIGCDVAPIDTAEAACWRLVACGAIPVANPAAEPDCCFDWAACVDYVDRQADDRYDFTLACVAAASCDELKLEGSPDRPNGSGQTVPLCLAHGDQ